MDGKDTRQERWESILISERGTKKLSSPSPLNIFCMALHWAQAHRRTHSECILWAPPPGDHGQLLPRSPALPGCTCAVRTPFHTFQFRLAVVWVFTSCNNAAKSISNLKGDADAGGHWGAMETLFLEVDARKVFYGHSCPLWSSSHTIGMVVSS